MAISNNDVGQVVRLAHLTTDPAGALVDVAGLALSVVLPDGTISGPLTPTRTATGTYYADFLTTQAGRHVLRWIGTSYLRTDVLNVWPADPRWLISLDDAKHALRLPASYGTGDDDDIRMYVAACTPVIEDITGPLVAVNATWTTDGGGSAIDLPVSGAGLSVSQVLVNGTALDPANYTLNAPAGVLYYGGSSSGSYGDDSDYRGHFLRGRQNVAITYSTHPVVPPNVLLATREELRYLWQIGQQGEQSQFGGGGGGDDDLEYTPSGFAVPRRVIELCAGNRRIPTIA